MKHITYVVLAVAMLFVGCNSRHRVEEIPVDISGLGKAGELIKDYEASAQSSFDNALFSKLDECLYALSKSQVVQENLSPEDIDKLRGFLFQRFVGLLEAEFQEGFCSNRHDYFSGLRAAVDSLRTKYEGIPDEQQQILAKLVGWYQQHQNACSVGVTYPSKQPSSVYDEYNVAQAERIIQVVYSGQSAYAYSSRCDVCKSYPSKVKSSLLENYGNFIAGLIRLYEVEGMSDDSIESKIEAQIRSLESLASKYNLPLSVEKYKKALSAAIIAKEAQEYQTPVDSASY